MIGARIDTSVPPNARIFPKFIRIVATSTLAAITRKAVTPQRICCSHCSLFNGLHSSYRLRQIKSLQHIYDTQKAM